MIDKIKSNFSIKDLENLTGIKAHTIRVWEKRYNMFEPNRSETNIRTYNLEAFQKLLNIVYLQNAGFKISKIAHMDDSSINTRVKELSINKNTNQQAINSFKLAMMRFDKELFSNTFNWLLTSKSLNEVFFETLVPLLEELGILWQTNSISPAHEHFISNLILQKLQVSIEHLSMQGNLKDGPVYVLALPTNEIHTLGIQLVHYNLLSKGRHTIYLGESMPPEFLKELNKNFDEIVYVSYFTVAPEADIIHEYVQNMENHLLVGQNKIWIIGKQTELLRKHDLAPQTQIFSNIYEFIKFL